MKELKQIYIGEITTITESKNKSLIGLTGKIIDETKNTFKIQTIKGIKTGNTLPLTKIPTGVVIYNIEGRPGDGGKFARTSGSSARIVAKSTKRIIVQLSSKKQKEFHKECMATIGVAAGAGRTDKPFLKAGNKFRYMKAKGKYWPIVSGASMNAVDHPLGGARSSRKGRPTIAPKNAPPGRKVGMIRPRQTGRNK